jgi:glutamate--cysteine ligase
MEPGGQIELSSLPAASISGAIDLLRRDTACLEAALADAGLGLSGTGLDSSRPPHRHLDEPRYAAMERAFDRDGPDGRVMMCTTAAVQISVDAGDASSTTTGVAERWHTAHAIGPVLVAAFANSPLQEGLPTGWRSSRQRAWLQMDGTRTAAVRGHGGCTDSEDPHEAWARYALDARVLMIRGADEWIVPDDLTFRAWLRGDGPRPATAEDLDYHLTTLFPPVRPRSWLELRMVDQQPGEGWVVAVAVAAALIEDARASDAAREACEPVAGRWALAARDGVADPAIERAAQSCFDAAVGALPRLGVDDDTRRAVDRFVDRYVSRGRCPADDQMESVAC